MYGFGQSSGSLSQWAAPGSAGIDSGTPHTQLQTYGVNLTGIAGAPSNGTSALLLETGTYTGAPPAFVLNSGNPSGDGVNVFTSSRPRGFGGGRYCFAGRDDCGDRLARHYRADLGNP